MLQFAVLPFSPSYFHHTLLFLYFMSDHTLFILKNPEAVALKKNPYLHIHTVVLRRTPRVSLSLTPYILMVRPYIN
jgi:hypothetical protein